MKYHYFKKKLYELSIHNFSLIQKIVEKNETGMTILPYPYESQN